MRLRVAGYWLRMPVEIWVRQMLLEKAPLLLESVKGDYREFFCGCSGVGLVQTASSGRAAGAGFIAIGAGIGVATTSG